MRVCPLITLLAVFLLLASPPCSAQSQGPDPLSPENLMQPEGSLLPGSESLGIPVTEDIRYPQRRNAVAPSATPAASSAPIAPPGGLLAEARGRVVQLSPKRVMLAAAVMTGLFVAIWVTLMARARKRRHAMRSYRTGPRRSLEQVVADVQHPSTATRQAASHEEPEATASARR